MQIRTAHQREGVPTVVLPVDITVYDGMDSHKPPLYLNLHVRPRLHAQCTELCCKHLICRFARHNNEREEQQWCNNMISLPASLPLSHATTSTEFAHETVAGAAMLRTI